MNSPTLKNWLVPLAAILLLAGCGRKEAPQIMSDSSFKPEIVGLTHTFDVNILQLEFSLKGSPAGVGYQIDRAEVDPYCNCPGFWRRYDERFPNPKLLEEPIKKLISVKVKNRAFLFRIRAYDDAGNIGPWSKMIRGQYADPSD